MKVNVALIQMDAKTGQIEYNRTHAKEMIRQAMNQEKRPDLILLPETWTSSYDPMRGDLEQQAARNAEGEDGESITMLQDLANEYGVWIAGGSITLKTKEDKRACNAMFLIDRQGNIAAQYRKIHLCGWVHEDDIFAPGKVPKTVATEIGSLGMVICYDVRFPELIRINALQGAEILLVPACFSTYLDHWRQMILARAIENQIFVLGCDCSGRDHVGHSMIVAPNGKVLAEAGVEEEIITAELDLDLIKETCNSVRYLNDRRPDIYSQHLCRLPSAGFSE